MAYLYNLADQMTQITGTATMNARFPGQWFQLERLLMSSMRIVFLTLLALSAGSACSAAAGLEPPPAGSPPACAIEIEFRTRRGEPEFDGVTLDRVLRFAEAVPAITQTYDMRRGHDHPPVLCLVIENTSQALEIFAQLTNIVPVPRVRLPRLRPAPPSCCATRAVDACAFRPQASQAYTRTSRACRRWCRGFVPCPNLGRNL